MSALEISLCDDLREIKCTLRKKHVKGVTYALQSHFQEFRKVSIILLIQVINNEKL